MRVRIPKSVYVPIASIMILLVLFVGGGIVYTWYVGQHSNQNISPPSETPAETQTVPIAKPIKPAPNANVGASVQMLTSPVAPGSNASINVKTTPTANCKILVEYNKVASKDSGLVPKTADEYGVISWTWTVESTVPVGKWPVKVTCEYNGKSAVVQGDLQVAR
jgi:hypothetical protein